jgi:aminoglycoside phosphotransferase (APT) family kinase protein
MADEMRVLRERLDLLAAQAPGWATRLGRLYDACARLAATVPAGDERGIHRDFYPDQVLVDGERLVLLDLDLYCLGDPALDIGNFVAHVIEYSLRARGAADALAAVTTALTERFARLAGAATVPAIEAYTTLTLARHVQLSTRFPERRHLTAALLALCEARLARPAPARA